MYELFIKGLSMPGEAPTLLTRLRNASFGSVSQVLSSIGGFLFNRKFRNEFVGALKENPDSINPILDDHIKRFTKYNELLPANFSHWSTDVEHELCTLLKTNPLLTPALRYTPGADGVTRIVINTSTTKVDGLFGFLMRRVSVDYPRVDAVFDENFKLLEFESEVNLTRKEAIIYLGVLLCLFGEITHAVFHIFDYLLTKGLKESILAENGGLASISQHYFSNVSLKCFEVDKLLFDEHTGMFTQDFGHFSKNDLEEYAKMVLDILMNCESAADVLSKFLFLDTNGLRYECKVLEELQKHADLITPFVDELHESLEISLEFHNLQARMLMFFDQVTTKKPGIRSWCQWHQLLSVTGLIHGATVGLTRFFVSAVFSHAFGRAHYPRWTSDDYIRLNETLATIVGVDEGRSVFEAPIGALNPYEHHCFAKYFVKSTELKFKYMRAVLAKPQEKASWYIHADWFPDGINGRQSTHTTYI